ncbi:MAG: 2-C-methyl-D-erythritol 2,4-cyclodiphosphate synthase [Spirochaetes bacterium]|nr:2-C-methyl-D-erythritol 2,4-cyclodiphosphate synthase [Spirochaetota bacterium]
MDIRVGSGFDVHSFSEGRALILGGVRIEHPRGLLGHSDADVLIHAIIDSLLGPADMGDIGTNFPDTDDRYRGARSLDLLRTVGGMLKEKHWGIVNIDAILVCRQPKIATHVPAMKQNISSALDGLAEERINIRGKTTEGLGFTGRDEGIAAMAVSLLSRD